MKNQIVLPVSQAKESPIVLWLYRENSLFSTILEEKVSNRQALLMVQAMTSFSILTCSVFLHWLAAVLCVLIVALQERRFAMTDYTPQPATFRVDKYQAYEDDKVLFEQYTILMYGSEKLCCTRPEMEQLSELIQTALNDRKETNHGR